ncbi:hypothetical protein DFJ73DRAFT_608453, partial [Zopfochytrium polystomum]
NPKLAAYLFAGRAFMYGTGLAVTGSVGATMLIASAMKVNTLQEFSLKARELSLKQFPALQGNHSEAEEKGEDDGSVEFMRELREELSKDEEDPYSKDSVHHMIRERLKKELGPLSK